MNSKIFLAEDVRQEQGGKLTVVGMYPDDAILFQGPHPGATFDPDAPPGMPKLCIVCVLANLEPGSYPFVGTLTDPAGTALVDRASLGTAVVPPQGSHTHTTVVQIAPFVAKELGDYTFVLSAKGVDVRYVFSVRRDQTVDAPHP